MFRNFLTILFFNFIAGLDYAYTKEAINFEPGETVALIIIPIVDNTAVESDEIFIAALSSEDNNIVIDSKFTTIMILDPDSKYPKGLFMPLIFTHSQFR